MDSEFKPIWEDIPFLLDFLTKNGCHGALLLGTTGEGPSFSLDERLRIFEAGLKIRQSEPNFRLFAGTGTPSLEETVFLNRSAFDLGIDGVVILPPYYFRNAGEDGIFAWFKVVVQRSVPEGAIFLVYHIPAITGISLSMDFLARLRDEFPDRQMGIKDSTADPEWARQLGERFGSDLLTFNGTDSLFDLALENKATGCITAMANLRSRDLRLVWEARQAGGHDEKACCRLKDYRKILSHYPPNPPLYKTLLYHVHGLPKWAVRPPLSEMTTQNLQEVLKELSELEENSCG